MAEESLKAKSAANEQLRLQALQAQEELDRKNTAYQEAVKKESALNEDSGFLRQQMEALLEERARMTERIALLERENKFLLGERDILCRQLELEKGEVDHAGTELTLTKALEARLVDEKRRRSESEALLAHEQHEVDVLRGVIQSLTTRHADREAAWEEREASLVRSLEAASLASLYNHPAPALEPHMLQAGAALLQSKESIIQRAWPAELDETDEVESQERRPLRRHPSKPKTPRATALARNRPPVPTEDSARHFHSLGHSSPGAHSCTGGDSMGSVTCAPSAACSVTYTSMAKPELVQKGLEEGVLVAETLPRAFAELAC
ncbi:hypothetical protein WJX72_011490 [[Myrmecia] bisecta]|uniref:Cilia- and flagella-associated protein 157 n=1 Tax=[Myrmecia] bisecta TaxID=41462 RepID=A0AAW1PQF2_9CHLO